MRELAGTGLHFFDCLVEGSLSGKHRDDLAVADCLGGGFGEWLGGGRECGHLVDEAGFEKTNHSSIDAVAQDSAGGARARTGTDSGAGWACSTEGLGAAGLLDDFEGADHPPAVVGMEPGRGRGIDGRQSSVKGDLTLRVGVALEALPQGRVGRRAG